jgi:hypothetical protein
MTYEYLAKLLKSIALSPRMVDSSCKIIEVAILQTEDGGGSLHVLEWRTTHLAKRFRSLAPESQYGGFTLQNVRGR